MVDSQHLSWGASQREMELRVDIYWEQAYIHLLYFLHGLVFHDSYVACFSCGISAGAPLSHFPFALPKLFGCLFHASVLDLLLLGPLSRPSP